MQIDGIIFYYLTGAILLLAFAIILHNLQQDADGSKKKHLK